MDVEYVILNEGKKKTIYIVQARPIVHDMKQQQPSYLDLNHPIVQSLTKLDGQAIGAAGGALRFINGTAGSVVKKGIGEALSSYQSRDNKNDVQAILIGKMAPATSHEATAFRSESKPVMAIEKDFDTLAGWAESEGAKLILDTQQQFVAQWKESFNPEQEKIIENFVDNNLAKKGWISYPLPQRISLQGDITPEQREILFRELDAKLFGGTSIQDKLKNFKLPVNKLAQQLKDWIFLVKTGTQQEASDALANLWVVFNFMPPQPDYAERINQLQTHAARIISYLLENLTIGSGDENYLGKRLFPTHFLETILFQHHKDSEGLYGDSVIKLWTQMNEEKKGVETVTTTDAYGKLIGILTSHGLTQDLKDNWKDFINTLDTTGKSMQDIMKVSKMQRQVAWLEKSIQALKPGNKNDELRQKLLEDLAEVQSELGAQTISDDDKNKAKFYQMLITLGKLDMLDLWLHTSFYVSLLIQQSDNLIKNFRTTNPVFKADNQGLADLETLWKTLHDNWNRLQHFDQFKNHTDCPQNPGYHTPMFQFQLKFVEQWETLIENWNKSPLAQLIKEFDNSEAFLIELLKYKQLIEDVNVAGFEDPTTFLKNWNAFQADPGNILDYFIHNNLFIQKFKDAQGLGKLAALGVMEELVTKFDAAIKAVTGSTKFIVTQLADGKSFDTIRADEASVKKQISTQKDKIFAFHLMLEKYLDLLQQWYILLKTQSSHYEEPLKNYKDGSGYDNLTVKTVLEQKVPSILNNLQSKTASPAELQSSPGGFHVGGATIGSQANWERSKPETHEDFFTFCHQSLLVIIAKFSGKYGIKPEQLPKALEIINTKITELEYQLIKAYQLGTLLRGNTLTLLYNFPQNQHSASIKVTYNKSLKSILISCSMFGANHRDRWSQCKDYIELECSLAKLPVTSYFKGRGIDVEWVLTDIKATPDQVIIGRVEETLNTISAIILGMCAIAPTANITSALKTDTQRLLKIIELSVPPPVGRSSRIHCSLPTALSDLSTDNYTEDVINQLIAITQELLEPGSEYALNSEILFYRKKYAPEVLNNPTGNKEVFYGITPNNFYELAGTNDIETYKHTNIRAIITKLLELRDILSADQKQAFLKLIKAHQEYIVDQWNQIKIAPSHGGYGYGYGGGYGHSPEVNLKTFFETLPDTDLKTEVLRQLVTQSDYGNNSAVYNAYYRNAPYGTPKVQPLLGADLKQFFVQRGSNILRTPACTALYQKVGNNMTQVEKESFVRLVGDALAHKDYLIRENANTLFATLQQDNSLQNTLAPYLKKINAVKLKQLDTLIVKMANDATDNSFEQALELIAKTTGKYNRSILSAIKIERHNASIKAEFQSVRDDISDEQWKNKFDDLVKACFRKKLEGEYVTSITRYNYSSYGNETTYTTNPLVLYIIDTIYEKFPHDQNLINLADAQLLDSIKHDALDTIIKTNQDEQDLFVQRAVTALGRKQAWELEALEKNAIRSYYSNLSSIEKLFAALIFLDAGVKSADFLKSVINEAKGLLSNHYSNSRDKDLAKKVLQKIIAIWDGLSFMQTPPGYTKKMLEDLVKPPAYGSSGYGSGYSSGYTPSSYGSGWSSGSGGYN
jgi:hypothetical protein